MSLIVGKFLLVFADCLSETFFYLCVFVLMILRQNFVVKNINNSLFLHSLRTFVSGSFLNSDSGQISTPVFFDALSRNELLQKNVERDAYFSFFLKVFYSTFFILALVVTQHQFLCSMIALLLFAHHHVFALESAKMKREICK